MPAKPRPAIRNLLRENPNVHCHATFPTADKLFAQHPIWQQAKVEFDRRLIFEEHARVETTVNGSYRLHRYYPAAATRLTPFLFSRVVVRKQSSTLQEHRGACQPVRRITSRHVDEMANRASDGTQIRRLEDRSGGPEVPCFECVTRFRGLQYVREFEEQTRGAQVEKNRKKGAESTVQRSQVGLPIFTHAGQVFQAESRPD